MANTQTNGIQKGRELKISVMRFNPENDQKPYMKDYKVNTNDFVGVMVLDILEHIKATQDPTLGLRRSCGEGVCGSDGMNINGKNGLACITSYVDLPNTIVIRPLPGFPIIRDLVVDMENFYKQYERAVPYLINDKAEPAREHLQSPAQRAELDGLYECILCACCSSSCPSYWWNPDKFMGPAALLWAARFLKDSRDTASKERLKRVNDAYSLFRCRTIMNCVNVCPKGLNPTKAISEVRTALLKEEV